MSNTVERAVHSSYPGRDQSRSFASQTDALVAHLKLVIEKRKRALYGARSESKQRLLEQLELQLEDA
jgi:transposase